MKKKYFGLIIFLAASLFLTYAGDTDSMEKKFIKGNIVDKTAAVKEASPDESALLSEQAIDFVTEYKDILGNDRDLSGLAVAGVFAVPKVTPELESKLIKLFTLFSDDTVRIAVLNKLSSQSEGAIQNFTVSSINSWLSTNVTTKAPENDVQKAAITFLGKFGNSDSFDLLFECYVQKIWPEEEAILETSIGNISENSLPEIIKIISSGSVDQILLISKLVLENTTISDFFKAQVAENVLSETIYIVDESPEKASETVSLQLTALSVLASNNWTRATELVQKYFLTARKEYQDGTLSEDQFVKVIGYTSYFATSDIAQTLATYLGDLNKKASDGSLPPKNVILAVITALGTLGDKTAFDNLLFVTYMDYPEDVVAAARTALAKLKW